MEPIQKITITGVDDDVTFTQIDDIIQFIYDNEPITNYERFDLEFALLFSEDRMGDPRYPSLEKIKKILRYAYSDSLAVALHLCGNSVNNVLQKYSDYADFLSNFNRVQINWNIQNKPDLFHDIVSFICKFHGSTIIQFNSKNSNIDTLIKEELLRRNSYRHLSKVQFLYDSSGGTGKLGLDNWKNLEVTVCDRIGFAGGITPYNVTDVLNNVCQSSKLANWIDFESGVRTDDKFDAQKVKELLLCAINFNKQVLRKENSDAEDI